MTRVIFRVQYEVDSEQMDEFKNIIKELKLINDFEGLERYSIYKIAGKKNIFEENMIFKSEADFENYDDGSNERLEKLTLKLEEVKLPNTTKYFTLKEIEY